MVKKIFYLVLIVVAGVLAYFGYQKFFEAASKEPYFKNTIFVFVGDHGIRGDAGRAALAAGMHLEDLKPASSLHFAQFDQHLNAAMAGRVWRWAATLC